MTGYSPVEKKVLTQLQRGIEPVSRPFKTFEIPEKEVLELLCRAKEEGLLRRFGGVFDARRLGYKSILCAMNVSPEQMEEKAAVVAAHPGVTHCYERYPLCGGGNRPELWFTLAMLRNEFEQGLAALRAQLAPGALFDLPALRRFKIDVIFDLQTRSRDEVFSDGGQVVALPPEEPFRTFSPDEKALVSTLDQQIPLTERPFAALAKELGRAEEAVLSLMQAWKEQGVLRRVGAILHHREAGFKANAMCVWPVDGDIVAAGRRVAARSEVSHCYQRPRLAAFPFDLYAMIHTGNWAATTALFEDISSSCGLRNGELFASGREFKKSSMKYFRS
jgi:DNA-binding Lrp family transcriptional regulator